VLRCRFVITIILNRKFEQVSNVLTGKIDTGCVGRLIWLFLTRGNATYRERHRKLKEKVVAGATYMARQG
jgi:hypothetical protein